MKVKIIFKEDSPWGKIEEIFDNVVEVHYGYESAIKDVQVAIEPYGTYRIKFIKEIIIL
ncbi:MAG: hypothetical protein PHF05_06425 [Candidatus Izemoplasmatales bacterium]|nr:hypothetical protein [Candidatus Izemoplasmatales bacterium]